MRVVWALMVEEPDTYDVGTHPALVEVFWSRDAAERVAAHLVGLQESRHLKTSKWRESDLSVVPIPIRQVRMSTWKSPLVGGRSGSRLRSSAVPEYRCARCGHRRDEHAGTKHLGACPGQHGLHARRFSAIGGTE